MRRKTKNKGFTLIELVVTIAILAIVSATFAVSYTNVMEDQRKQSDFANLNQIDISIKQLYLYEDAFEEAKNTVYDDNKIKLTFPVTYDDVESTSFIELEDAELINGDKFADECPIAYKYLVDLVGERIDLQANSHKQGYYEILIEFNCAQVSEVRVPTITNDGIIVTSSEDKYLKEH